MYLHSGLSVSFILITTYLFLSTNLIVAQPKFEQEFRVETEDIPSLALSFVDSCRFEKRVKWYQEISNDGASVEAKSRLPKSRNRISIEFDTLGNLQDIEITISVKKIPEPTLRMIESDLGSKFKRFRIEKVQLQGVGNREYLLSVVQGNVELKERNYEIIVNGRKEKGHVSYEFLFSGEGKLLRESEIVTQKTDHLDF